MQIPLFQCPLLQISDEIRFRMLSVGHGTQNAKREKAQLVQEAMMQLLAWHICLGH